MFTLEKLDIGFGSYFKNLFSLKFKLIFKSSWSCLITMLSLQISFLRRGYDSMQYFLRKGKEIGKKIRTKNVKKTATNVQRTIHHGLVLVQLNLFVHCWNGGRAIMVTLYCSSIQML